MEAILQQYDDRQLQQEQNVAADHHHHNNNNNNNESPHYNPKDVADALRRFTEALRDVLPLLDDYQQRHLASIQQQQSAVEGGGDDGSGTSAVDAKWLLRILREVPSDLGTEQMARLIVEASQLSDSQQQEEALFATLGASEEAMNALFQIFPHMSDIQKNVKLHDLGFHQDQESNNDPENHHHQHHFSSSEAVTDPAEADRQRLRQEAWNAAQVAAIAQAEADAASMGPSGIVGGGATHTITRSSEVQLQKAARKAHKRAAQTLQKAKEAGAILDDADLMSMQNATSGSMLGQGGLVGRSRDELLALQASLMPEGSRKYYTDQGLPDGTERVDDDIIGYEKVTIPPPYLDASRLHARLRIDDILDPECARAFSGTASLNPMQSTVFETAFHRRENMLVCAPTGAGKTNVAMLTVTAHFRDVGLLRSHNHHDSDNGGISILETGKKAVYIAPMKALAQEVVEKFSSKLKPLGLIVRELTGDMQLTRAEAESANVIVTTPEKWDVVTRKSGNDDKSLGNQCGLLIIDEVHLLADDRGAVIESVVARLHRLVESRQKQLRIVGLSATLPNYQDVAEFLQVPERGLYYFGPEHRPVPLQQCFIGVTGNVKDRFLIENKMNDVCYETVLDSLKRGYQVMVFVHSRKGTGDAASALAQRASAATVLDRYFTTQGKEGAAGDAYKRYADRAKKSRNREVSNHFYNGMGIHHAGMLRGDRKLTESMFADGAIKVLCCTATLAWGINLPAHTVVVKGTDIYNPEKGKMVDLSILDVQQIFGRAGRPQFDTSGEATLITNHGALNRYLDKLVRAVPIESNFVKQLADHLNAEVVGGTVTNLKEAANWLSYTYLYVRMLRNPLAYGISADKKADDPMLRGRLLELVKDAVITLSSEKMISFDPASGNMSMTTLGRVAAHFYIQAESVATFNGAMELKTFLSDSDLLRMISSANEFENLRVRQEEQSELDELQQACPLELLGPVNDSTTKTYVLLQAFISRQRPKSFTLISDTNYIASNAGRVARAIFEMCLHKNKAGSALKLLRLAKSIDAQIWWFQTPLRHFEAELGGHTIKALESRLNRAGKGYDSLESTLSLLDMTPEEVGQLCQSKKAVGANIQQFVGMIPKTIIECKVQPVTRDVIRFQIEISPDFEWQGRWHGSAVFFWLWIQDAQNDGIHHQEQIMFSKKNYPESVYLDVFVPALEGGASQYLLRIVSDSWVGVEVVNPVSLKDTRLPERVTINTALLDLTPLPTTALQDAKYEKLFDRIETFNPVQTQLFHVLYHTDVPVLLGAPTGSGKTVVGELAILRMKRLHKNGICVYIAPLKSLARERLKEWQRRFGSAPMHWKVLELSGDTHHDRRALEEADILVCTPEKWDLISRGWRGPSADVASTDDENKRSFVKRVRLLVIDEIHLLGEERGAVLEAIVSRTRFISRSLKLQHQSGSNDSSDMIRIVGLSTAVANPLDLADWIGIETTGTHPGARQGLYNFRPSIRPVETKIHVQGYPGKHYCPRMATMNKPCYAAIKQYSPDRPSLIFVASRRQTRLTAFDIITYAAADENPKAFLGCDESYIEAIASSIQDDALKHTITFGIGLHHAGLSSSDRDIVERLYLGGEIRVLVATATLAWVSRGSNFQPVSCYSSFTHTSTNIVVRFSFQKGVNLPARLVIVKGTEYFDGKTSRYVDYPLTDVLQMIGRAGRPGFDTRGEALVLCETSKKSFYKKFLYTPFPVESCLRQRLPENLNAEIASGTLATVIDAVGYLTWTFFARRVKGNPSYYGAKSSSPEDVEEFLTQVATESLDMLKDESCIEIYDDETVKVTVLGKATSEYYLNHRTAKQMELGLKECAKLIMTEKSNSMGNNDDKKLGTSMDIMKLHPITRSVRMEEGSIAWLLYSLCYTHEFDEIPVRHNEEFLNQDLSSSVMWGADTSIIFSSDGQARHVDIDVYADSHTKGFLLVQAYLEKVQLPISDYVNDSKTVMDSIPRLLAAMQAIASHDITASGSFDVLCQLIRTKQLISTRSTIFTHPATRLSGMNESSFDTLMDVLSKDRSNTGTTNKKSLWSLRRYSRDRVADAIQNVRNGVFKANVPTVLNSIFAVPLVSVKNSKIYHEIEKTTGRSMGTLKLSLEVERERPSSSSSSKQQQQQRDTDNNFVTLTLVVGTPIHSKLLALSEISISRYGSWTVDTEIQFDWRMANSDSGQGDDPHVILRLLLDSYRGLDSEIMIGLK
jgi:activating signal cointegrator complex subunit 3